MSISKCLKQATVKKSVFGEKPAVRRGPVTLQLGRIPLVRGAGIDTVQAFGEQQNIVSQARRINIGSKRWGTTEQVQFLNLLQEDGTIESQ